MTVGRPDYGLDAPGVVRNLFVAAALGLALFASRAFGVWSTVLSLGPVRIELGRNGPWRRARLSRDGDVDDLDQ